MTLLFDTLVPLSLLVSCLFGSFLLSAYPSLCPLGCPKDLKKCFVGCAWQPGGIRRNFDKPPPRQLYSFVLGIVQALLKYEIIFNTFIQKFSAHFSYRNKNIIQYIETTVNDLQIITFHFLRFLTIKYAQRNDKVPLCIG